MPESPASEPDPIQRRLLLEQVEASLKVKSDEIDGLDRKATTVLAATGVLLGLVINNADDFTDAPWIVGLFFYEALVVLAFGLISGVLTLWPVHYAFAPVPRPFLDDEASKMPGTIMGGLANEKADAFDANRKVSETKGGRLRIQMILLASGGGVLVAAYLLERWF